MMKKGSVYIEIIFFHLGKTKKNCSHARVKNAPLMSHYIKVKLINVGPRHTQNNTHTHTSKVGVHPTKKKELCVYGVFVTET